jgi:hypothetical protein
MMIVTSVCDLLVVPGLAVELDECPEWRQERGGATAGEDSATTGGEGVGEQAVSDPDLALDSGVRGYLFEQLLGE